MIDLDDFKIYNDTFGHSAGDAALKTVVKQIRSCVRSTDSIVRYGGDEFLLLIPGIDEDTFVKKLRETRESGMLQRCSRLFNYTSVCQCWRFVLQQ